MPEIELACQTCLDLHTTPPLGLQQPIVGCRVALQCRTLVIELGCEGNHSTTGSAQVAGIRQCEMPVCPWDEDGAPPSHDCCQGKQAEETVAFLRWCAVKVVGHNGPCVANLSFSSNEMIPGFTQPHYPEDDSMSIMMII